MTTDGSKKAFLLALTANVLWASSFVGSKFTLLSWGPYTSVFLRFALSFLVLLVFYSAVGIKITIPKSRKQLSAIVALGLILGALYSLQLSGLLYISTGFSASIMLLAPLILVIFAPLIASERTEHQKIIAIVIGIMGGLILLSSKLSLTSEAPLGVWLTLGAAVCLAIFTLLSRRFSIILDHPTLTLYSFVVGAVAIAPFALFEAPIAQMASEFSKSLIALFYLVIACTAIPFFIWNRATSMTEAKNLASTMHAKTPAAIILGVVFFNETITWTLVLGTVIVTFALWLSQAKNIFKQKIEKGNLNHEREPIGSAVFQKIN